MFKAILTAVLLGSAARTQAQWVALSANNSPIAPNHAVKCIQAVTPALAWGLATPLGGGNKANAFCRTNDPSGTNLLFNSLGSAPGYSAFGIYALDASTAYVAQNNSDFGLGEIIRTTNGGNSWQKVTTAAQFAGGFCNWVYMFDANEGVAFGDPNGGSFEVLRTSNGGNTWTRLPAANLPAPLNAYEYGVSTFFGLGNTVWAGTARTTGNGNQPVRIFKSTDRGHTWTAAFTPLPGAVHGIAFKDSLNGLASSIMPTGATVGSNFLARTTDGGLTWQAITPLNSPTGCFYLHGLDAVPGGNGYLSIGPRLITMNTITDFGFSFSSDGITWRDIQRGLTTANVFMGPEIDAISPTVVYGAGRYSTTTNEGVFKWGSGFALSNQLAAKEPQLQVYPNPSTDGLFRLGGWVWAGHDAALTVTDALGRQVAALLLRGTSAPDATASLDLRKLPAGVYLLRVSTVTGSATQKLVIQ